MTDDLDNLRPEVREAMDAVTSHFAIAGADLPGAGAWRMCRDELLRLARENDEWQTRCLQFQTERDKARAELAAIKARILPGTAKVEIADTDGPDGNPYGWVGGTLLSNNLIGKRVALVKVEE